MPSVPAPCIVIPNFSRYISLYRPNYTIQYIFPFTYLFTYIVHTYLLINLHKGIHTAPLINFNSIHIFIFLVSTTVHTLIHVFYSVEVSSWEYWDYSLACRFILEQDNVYVWFSFCLLPFLIFFSVCFFNIENNNPSDPSHTLYLWQLCKY